MIQIKSQLNITILILVFLVFSSSARAEDDYRSHQLHFRTGPLSTSISGGGVSKTYSVNTTVDVEYETFSNSKNSLIFRGTIAQSSTLARAVYAFMGVGKRFYFSSTGIAAHMSGNGFEVDHVPKKRYYYGVDVGYSSGVISVLKGTSLQTMTSMIDVGAVVGFMYQLSRSNAIDAQFGYSYGYGFSGVAASAQTMRTLIGIAHSF